MSEHTMDPTKSGLQKSSISKNLDIASLLNTHNPENEPEECISTKCNHFFKSSMERHEKYKKLAMNPSSGQNSTGIMQLQVEQMKKIVDSHLNIFKATNTHQKTCQDFTSPSSKNILHFFKILEKIEETSNIFLNACLDPLPQIPPSMSSNVKEEDRENSVYFPNFVTMKSDNTDPNISMFFFDIISCKSNFSNLKSSELQYSTFTSFYSSFFTFSERKKRISFAWDNQQMKLLSIEVPGSFSSKEFIDHQFVEHWNDQILSIHKLSDQNNETQGKVKRLEWIWCWKLIFFVITRLVFESPDLDTSIFPFSELNSFLQSKISSQNLSLFTLKTEKSNQICEIELETSYSEKNQLIIYLVPQFHSQVKNSDIPSNFPHLPNFRIGCICNSKPKTCFFPILTFGTVIFETGFQQQLFQSNFESQFPTLFIPTSSAQALVPKAPTASTTLPGSMGVLMGHSFSLSSAVSASANTGRRIEDIYTSSSSSSSSSKRLVTVTKRVQDYTTGYTFSFADHHQFATGGNTTTNQPSAGTVSSGAPASARVLKFDWLPPLFSSQKLLTSSSFEDCLSRMHSFYFMESLLHSAFDCKNEPKITRHDNNHEFEIDVAFSTKYSDFTVKIQSFGKIEEKKASYKLFLELNFNADGISLVSFLSSPSKEKIGLENEQLLLNLIKKTRSLPILSHFLLQNISKAI